MTTELIALISSKLERQDALIALIKRRLETTDQPAMSDYYTRVLNELQPAHDALAAMVTALTSDNPELITKNALYLGIMVRARYVVLALYEFLIASP